MTICVAGLISLGLLLSALLGATFKIVAVRAGIRLRWTPAVLIGALVAFGPVLSAPIAEVWER